MKKLLIPFISLLFTTGIFAQDLVYTVEATNGTNNAYAKSCVITVNSVDWTVQGNTKLSGGWGLGGKSLTKVQRTIFCKSLPYSFDSISITHKLNNGITVDNFYAILDSDSIFGTQEQIALMQDSNAVVNFKFVQVYNNPSVSFVYVLTNSDGKNNKRIEFNKAEFYKTKRDVVTYISSPSIKQDNKLVLIGNQLLIKTDDDKLYNLMGQQIQ